MYRREIGWEGVEWIHLAQGKGPVAGCCEHDHELSGSVQGGKFLYQLSDCKLLK
jgi:hypothetical protein